MFTFTLLGQADSEDPNKNLDIHQSLLTFSQVNILIDVGWDYELSTSLEHLIKLAPAINAILLTHATISHLGAYAYLVKMAPEFASIPVYATLPVVNMGRIITLDAYRTKGLLGPVLGASLQVSDVEAAFDRIELLKYSQPFPLTGILNGIVITAFNAGHSLGGTFWRLQKDQENVVYAVDWNHSRDMFLNGASLLHHGKVLESLSKPTVFISGSKFGQQLGTLSVRKDNLFHSIRRTLDRGGSVLLPTSSGCRVLELILLLESFMEAERIDCPFLYYSHVASRTLSYASSMLEWMSSSVIDEWQKKNSSPFETKYLNVTSDLTDLASSGPKIILASSETLELGFSKPIFSKICTDDTNLIILTENCASGTLANHLFEIWKEGRLADDDSLPVQANSDYHLKFREEETLEGDDLEEYHKMVQTLKDEQDRQEAIDMRNRNLLDEGENDVFDEEDSDDELDYGATSKVDTAILLYGKDVYDYDVREAKGKSRMFPYIPKRQKIDDYGEAIKASDFSKNNEVAFVADGSIVPANGNAGAGANGGDPMNIDGDGAAKIGETRQWGTDHKFGEETVKLDMLSGDSLPKKITNVSEDVKIKCFVTYIDFEGLADENSLKEVIPSIQPRKFIALPSLIEDSAAHLVESLIGSGMDNSVIAGYNEPINASVNTFAFDVKVSPELESLLKWQKILSDYSVAHVTGKLKRIEQIGNTISDSMELDAPSVSAAAEENAQSKQDVANDTMKQLQQLQESQNKDQFVLVPLETAQDLAAAPRSNPLLVGDIKLTELKRKLVTMGHNAEFRAEGVLVCDEKIAVRKIAEGRLVIEGGIDDEFYEIKTIVRSLLALV